MAVTYQFTTPDNTVAQRSNDMAFVPWDPVAKCPRGEGLAYRQWVDQGSPQPTPYVPPS